MIEIALLNCIIATRDFGALVKHGLNHRKHFREQECAYEYIEGHLKEYGEMPSVESVILNCRTFEAMEVVESIDTLALKLVERNLKQDQKELLKEVAGNFGSMDAYKVHEKLRENVEKMDEIVLARGKQGVNWAQNGEARKSEYEARKQKDFSVTIPLFFEAVTDACGGAERGDIIVIQASTGKGKSWLGLLQGLVAHKAGFRGLIESAEMGKEENQFRLDTLNGCFSNKGLWTGQLQNELAYFKYLEKFSRDNKSPDLIIKTPEDWQEGLTIEQLEYDIDKAKADFVVIDQFNLMRTKGGKEAKADLSRRLKQLAAKKGCVIFLLYQTNGEYIKGSSSKSDDGIKELKLPTLADYSETIAVQQDSSKFFGFDAVTWRDEETGRMRGKALVGVLKNRAGGGEGLEIELDYQPNDGIIRPRVASDMF